MANKDIELTEEGLEALRKEYRELIDVKRPEVLEALQAARAMGDLSENADYDAARNRQAEVEGRIKQIEAILNNAKVIKEDKNKKDKGIKISNTVKILDLSDNKEYVYQIVSSVESNPFEGKISNVSALGEALLGHLVNDVVEVKANKVYSVKVLEIK